MRTEMTKSERKNMAKASNDRSQRKVALVRNNENGSVLYNKGGIWMKRAAVDAKESAHWLQLLLDMQDARYTRSVKPLNFVQKFDYITYRETLTPSMAFDSNDRAYEVSRRRLANAECSEALGHPAQAAALVFCDGLEAAQYVLGCGYNEMVELGAKKLMAAIGKFNTIIDDINDQLHDMRLELRRMDWIKSSLDDDMKLVIWECMKDLRPEIRELEKKAEEWKAERRVLNKALKVIRDNADEAQRALIDARAEVMAKKARAIKNPVGRQVKMVARPTLKSYKSLSLVMDNMLPETLKSVKQSFMRDCAKFLKTENELKEEETDKTFADLEADKAKAKASFMVLKDTAKAFHESGKPFETTALLCQINNNKQSMLSDVIGVAYGKTTNMLISVDHSVAEFLPKYVLRILDDDPEIAQKMIDELYTHLIEIQTEIGINVGFPTTKGKMVYRHYKFWNANNSALKVGKYYALSDEAYAKAKEAAQAGMTDEQFENIKTNGSDMLKWWSYATTPGCPLMYEGKPLTVNDVLVVDSIDIIRVFQNVMVWKEDENGNGTWTICNYAEVKRTAYDGQLFFMVPIPSQQVRGGMAFKGFGLNCALENGRNMVDEIAAREGLEVPEYIKDIDGKMRRWREYKVICTKDCWKWASWGISYEEYCARMNKLAEKYPTVNQLYTARIADATEEGRRKLTRQSIQQFMFASDDQIAELTRRSIARLQRMNTLKGVIRKMAGLDKEEDERTPFEHLIEASPEMLFHPFMRKHVEDTFNRDLAEAAVRPVVDGIYPYIAEDPVAFFKIVIFGMDPNKTGLGYLKDGQVNIYNAEEGKKMYIVRYPNNYLCGMVVAHHNDDIYRNVGNVMVLSLDGYYLIRADGDVDGDEMCAIFDEVVIEMMEETIKTVKPPLVIFPHPKMGKDFIRGHKERAKALAKAIVVANKFGPAVGQNSNLATKFMNLASVARVAAAAALKNGDMKTKQKMEYVAKMQMLNAIVAHIAAIIAIDLAKTGEMPAWLQKKLADIRKFAGKEMPWNQRFCKDNKAMPWFSPEWDKTTRPRDVGIVDRVAGMTLDKVNGATYKAPGETKDFDIKSILCDTNGLIVNGSKAKLESDKFRSLEARNFLKKNDDNDDEYALIEKLKSVKPDDVVGPAEMWRFFWRNMASLMYVLKKDDSDKLGNAEAVQAYYEFVHDIMLDFGSYCGNEAFMKLSPEKRALSNVWKAAVTAYNQNNGVGKQAKSEEDRFSARASHCVFVTRVIAYELYVMACDKKGIINRWMKPEKTIVDQDALEGAVCIDGLVEGESYSLAEHCESFGGYFDQW